MDSAGKVLGSFRIVFGSPLQVAERQIRIFLFEQCFQGRICDLLEFNHLRLIRGVNSMRGKIGVSLRDIVRHLPNPLRGRNRLPPILLSVQVVFDKCLRKRLPLGRRASNTSCQSLEAIFVTRPHNGCAVIYRADILQSLLFRNQIQIPASKYRQNALHLGHALGKLIGFFA